MTMLELKTIIQNIPLHTAVGAIILMYAILLLAFAIGSISNSPKNTKGGY